MPFAALAPFLPAIIGAGASVGGALLSGKGGSSAKNTNQQDTTSTQNAEEKFSKTSGFETGSDAEGLSTPIEDPLDYLFRQNLYGALTKEYGKTSKPLYGEAEKAGFLSNLNDLAGSSMQAIKGSLSGRGLLGSGFLDRAAADVETNRLSQYGAFLRDVPRLNEESRMKNVAGLLGLGGSFGALAPRGQYTKGSQSQAGTSAEMGNASKTATTTGSGTIVGSGPGFGSQVATNAGGVLGEIGGSIIDDLLGSWSDKNDRGGGGSWRDGGYDEDGWT